MSLDILLFIFLLLGFFQGFWKGFIDALFSLVGTFLGLVLALKLSAVVGGWLFTGEHVGSRWAVFVSFLLVFLAVVIGVRFLAGLAEGAARLLMLGLVNRIAGAVLQTFITAVMLSAFLYLLTLTGILSESIISASWFYPRLAPLAPKVFGWLGELMPFLKDMLHDLNQSLSPEPHVGTT